MKLTIDELLQIIGGKEAELFALRRRVAELEVQAEAQNDEPEGE